MPDTLLPTHAMASTGGVTIAAYDLGGSGPPMLLAHASGFCGQVLVPLARHLAGTFRLFAFDERGHGRSGRPSDGDFDWHGFADDVSAVVGGLALDRPFAFGHSCGGAALLLAEQARPGTFSGMFLFEPVVGMHATPGPPSFDNPLVAGARRRRERFGSAAEAMARFAAHGPLSVLRPDALAAYVSGGFAEEPDGSIVLRCRREDEAAVYAHGFSHDAFARLPEVRCRVVLACGDQSDSFGVDHLQACADRLPDASVEVFTGLGHFGPLQDPESVARAVTRSLTAAGPRVDTPRT